jgi:hypothetical protein
LAGLPYAAQPAMSRHFLLKIGRPAGTGPQRKIEEGQRVDPP